MEGLFIMNSKSVKEGGIKSMYSKSKRFIASFLAVLMAVCMLPADVLGGVGVVNAAGEITATIDNVPVTANQQVEDNTTVTLAVADTVTGATDIIWSLEDGTDFSDVTVAQYTTASKKALSDTVKTADVNITGTANSSVTLTAAVVKHTPAVEANTEAGTEAVEEGVDTLATASFTFTIKENGGTDPNPGTLTNLNTTTVTLSKDTIEAGEEVPTVTVTDADGSVVDDNEYDVKYFINVEGQPTEKNADELKGLTVAEGTTVTVTVKVTAKTTSTTYTGSAADKTFIITPATQGTTVTAPTASPVAGAVAANTQVTLTAATGATIYAVTKTAAETSASGFTAPTGDEIAVPANECTEAIEISEAMTIYAVAKVGDDLSDVASFAYTIKAAGQEATIKLDFNSSRFTNGTANLVYNDGYFSFKHDKNNSIKQGSSFTVDTGITNVSAGTLKYYNIGGKSTAGNATRAIRFTPTSDAVVTVGCSGDGVNFGLLKSDGSALDDTKQKTVSGASKVYELTFNVTGDGETEYAIGSPQNACFHYVIVKESAYTVKQPVVIGEAPGEVQAGTEITLNAPEGYDIYYAIGDTVTVGTDTKYNGGKITIDVAKTITAVAKQTDGDLVSEPAHFVYTIAKTLAQTPNPSVPSGIYDEAQSVTLTSDATVYYTTDGSNPVGNEDAIPANGAITVDKTQVIKAYAVSDETSPSPVVTLTYIINHDTPNKKYVLNMADETVRTSPAVDAEGYGDDIKLGNEGYFKVLVAPGKDIVKEIGNITGDLGNNVTGNNYDVNNLPGWPAEEAGALATNSKVLTLTGGAMTDNNNTNIVNAAKIIVSANTAKVTVYYAVKKGTSALDVYKADSYGDSDLGTQLETTKLTLTPNEASTSSKMIKAEFEATAGIYYLGFHDNGGIIPYMEVTENPDTTNPEPPAAVAKPEFDPAGEAGTEYQFDISEATVKITAEDEAEIYYALSTEAEKYAAFEAADDVAGYMASTAGAKYEGPITVADGMTIKAVAIKGGKASEVATSPAYKLGTLATLKGEISATLSSGTADIKAGDKVAVTLSYANAEGENYEAANVKLVYGTGETEPAIAIKGDGTADVTGTPYEGAFSLDTAAAGKTVVKATAYAV
ncbi:MAG: chitobiase/beta-hexosaminidase C-terminal domain-containing protein, partial [Roseburia sp.]|nr:chitobiase/beta-hexosaminidase C-terminal domain-containing protein [Roseburia sp.]